MPVAGATYNPDDADLGDFTMTRKFWLALGLIWALPLWAVTEVEMPANDISLARATAVGETVELQHLPVAAEQTGAVRMKRIDVYASDARLLVPDGAGYLEVPRSDWLHFVADRSQPGSPRLGLSLSPDGRQAQGLLLANDGLSYAIDGVVFGDGLKLSLSDASRDRRGAPTDFVCSNDRAGWQSLVLPDGKSLQLDPALIKVTESASRSAVVAVDTDNEFMLQKFSDNTTNASNYLAALFVAMNVLYERDLDLTLTQGTTLLRTSGTADPFADPGTNGLDQLDEFGEVWAATQNATPRAFAMLLSGKSPNAFSASGIAWVLGNSNYCNQKNNVFNGCGDGQCTSGHYSATQVFKFNGSTAANDVLVIAHELGHNFGANHTHCSDATSGAGPQSSNTIDQCFNGESGSGCFGGTQVCPAPTTVNGVSNVRGTLMSYCHLNGIGGCTSSQVFATAHRTLLTPRVTNNVNLGCFTSTSAINQAPTLNAISNPAAILEDASQQTVSLNGIGDGDGGTQVITVTASSNNTSLIPNPSVSYSSPNSSGSISYTPVANQSGSAQITVTVTDNGGTTGGGVNSFSRNFTVNVTAVNDPPTLNAINNPAPIATGAGLQTINLSGISAGPGETQTLTVTAASSNTGLIPNPSVSHTSPNATGSISYTPVAGQQGSATITVTVTDNGGTANGGQNSVSRQFVQTVNGNALFSNGFE